MSEDRIRKNETDLLSAAINRIISSEVLDDSLSHQLPLTNDLTDSNKIYHGKASMLFVDMRESTKMPEKFSTEQLVKIYRSYIRAVVQAIRYSGGVVRDFMGDGVLAVFVDDEDGKSEDKSVRAARYITTAIDKFLNPVLDKAINHRISCGIGIHTGNISLSKVGMKGKEQQDNAESEFGIAWIGNSTNLACKFSSTVNAGAIFISPSTYAALSDIEAKKNWEKTEVQKGTNVLGGYIATHYYLPLDDEVEPCSAENVTPVLGLRDELKREYQKYFAAISQKAEDLGRKEQLLQDKECELNRKEQEIISAKKDIGREKYDFYCDVLRGGHCQRDYVLKMGEDFWEDYLADAIDAGLKIGKKERDIKQEVSFAMVSIYAYFEMYDKAYDFLIEQATGYAWLNLSVVKNIVKKAKRRERLISALYIRLAQNNLSPENRRDFEEIKTWLISKCDD